MAIKDTSFSEGPKKVVVVSRDPRVLGSCACLLNSAGHRLTLFDSVPEANAWLRMHPADVVAVDVEEVSWAEASSTIQQWECLQPSGQSSAHPLIFAREHHAKRVWQILENIGLVNLIGVHEDEGVDPLELMTTIHKIGAQDVFGMEKYLRDGQILGEWKLCESVAREGLFDEVGKLAQTTGCHSHLVSQFITALDELVTNAFYNAPCDKDGTRRFAQWDRKKPVQLESNESIEIKVASDNGRLGISVSDPFGSLRPSDMQQYLAAAFARDQAPLLNHANHGGAGIGLSMVLSSFHELVINIQPNQRTEFVGFVHPQKSVRKALSRAKSFNVFLV